MIISCFDGPDRFLSNFWPCKVTLDGVEYASTEHAYQAAKSDDPGYRAAVAASTSPNFAKRLGRKAKLRADWEFVKLGIMEDLLRQKFAAGTELAAKLIATSGKELVEGNWWGDVFWGQCPLGVGDNHLGKLLMKIREELNSPLLIQQQESFMVYVGGKRGEVPAFRCTECGSNCFHKQKDKPSHYICNGCGAAYEGSK
jgi:ribA/ribD-fused uncharacterized protein